MGSNSVWRRALVRANLRLVKRLTRAVRREYAVVAAEFAAGAWDAGKHRARVTHLLRTHYELAFERFGKLAVAMLDGAAPRELQKREEAKPETEAARRARVVAVLTALVAVSVAEETLGAVVEELLQEKAVVAAVSAALAREPTFSGAVAAAARDPAVAAAVLSAVTGGAGAPPAARPPTGDEPPTRRPSYRARVSRFVERYARERGQRISEGTRALVTRVVAEAAREGVFGESAVAARLTEELTGTRRSSYRARRIARTEIGAAQNAALLEMAEDRGKPFAKTWVAVDDPRTRPTHAAADGQKIRAGERFDVGDARLSHPGDPDGPLGEIVNCRCSMLLETVE